MYGYIYKTTNLVNGKIYVGKHKSNEFDTHYYGSGKYLSSAINKYGLENFICEILESCDSLDLLNSREVYWINKLDSRNKEIGYNISYGGDGMSPMPLGIRDKLRQMNLGKKYPDDEDSKRRRSLAHIGKHSLTEKQIQMLADARRNSGCYLRRKPMSEDTKRKIGDSNRHPNDTVWITDGQNNLKIKSCELQSYIYRGYTKGRTITWNTRPNK